MQFKTTTSSTKKYYIKSKARLVISSQCTRPHSPHTCSTLWEALEKPRGRSRDFWNWKIPSRFLFPGSICRRWLDMVPHHHKQQKALTVLLVCHNDGAEESESHFDTQSQEALSWNEMEFRPFVECDWHFEHNSLPRPPEFSRTIKPTVT